MVLRLPDAMLRIFFLALALSLTATAFAQQTVAAPPASITLEQAIALARANEPNFAAAAANKRVAALDHSIAQAALLPNVSYHNQVLYTQPNGAFNGGGPVGSQSLRGSSPTTRCASMPARASSRKRFGLQQLTAVSRASAADAVAAAEFEIARRGLVATVTGLFYQALAADRKVGVAQRAAGESASFTKLTQQREGAREAAHADVVKAQLQQQQRDRDLADALLEQQKSHLDLGVLLFADPRAAYTLVPGAVVPLPSRADVDAAAMKLNPELHQALASLRVSTSM